MNLTLTEATKAFLDHCRIAKCLSNHTLRAYAGDLGQFAGFVRGEMMVGRIDRDQLRAFARFLFDHEKLKETSVRRKLATLKVMFRWLETEEAIEITPFHRLQMPIRLPKRLPKALIERLIPFADGDTRDAILDLFRTNSVLPADEHTTRLLALLVAYPDMLKGRSTFLIDRLKESLEHTLPPQLVLSVVEAFIRLNFTDLGDVRSSLAGDVDDLIDIVLTLQRTPEFRSKSTDLFEILLENGAYGIDKTLKEIDKRL